jgi:hypothetical protein
MSLSLLGWVVAYSVSFDRFCGASFSSRPLERFGYRFDTSLLY